MCAGFPRASLTISLTCTHKSSKSVHTNCALHSMQAELHLPAGEAKARQARGDGISSNVYWAHRCICTTSALHFMFVLCSSKFGC